MTTAKKNNEKTELVEKTETKQKTIVNITKVYSMESADTTFTLYHKPRDGVLVEARKAKFEVTIKGGAKVAFSDTRKVIRNQDFVMTKISKEQSEALQDNPVFNRAVKRGFIVINKEPTVFITDASAQITRDQMKEKLPNIDMSISDKAIN